MAFSKVTKITTPSWTGVTGITTPTWVMSAAGYKLLQEDAYNILQEDSSFLLVDAGAIWENVSFPTAWLWENKHIKWEDEHTKWENSGI